MKKLITFAAVILTGLFGILVSFLVFGSYWGLHKWDSLDINEIIFQLQAPLEGTDSGIIHDYLLRGLLPVLVLAGLYIGAQVLLTLKKKDRIRRWVTAGCLAASLAGCIWLYHAVWQGLGIGEWIAAQNSDYDFIADRYVDPKDVELEFPEKKRNLIFIYLESMETSFADQASGGGMDQNLIPELTKIARQNEDFSGSEDTLNGGIVGIGNTFTSGAMWGMTAGIPLRVDIGGNNMDTQDSFFPDVTTLGDILEKEGYRQIFLCGSDATFGGRRLMLRDHGNYEFRDHPYAIEQGLIPADYYEFWGYEDEKMFSYAKDTLLELAKDEEQPFNLTMLTVDTHFPHGYECRLCREDAGDNQYENAIACSGRQVAEFLSWVQEQDFYENTTVILTGDHLTMSTDLSEDIDPEYLRKTYTAFVNTAVQAENKEERRVYSTIDLFPTTLAALGVRIDGNRMGLGTNLFSTDRTLLEEYGEQQYRTLIGLGSKFLKKMEKTDTLSDALVRRYRKQIRNKISLEDFDPGTGRGRIRGYMHYTGASPNVDHYDAVCREYGSDREQHVTLVQEKGEENKEYYSADIDLSSWNSMDGEIRIDLYMEDGSELENLTTLVVSDLLFLHDDYNGYLKCLKEDERFRNMSILFAAKDEATRDLTEENVSNMKALGLEKAEEIAGQYRISYVALVEPGNVQEQAGYAKLSMSGVLQDGKTSFLASSGGHDYGNKASLMINDEEMAYNHRGMNIVVFDPERGIVIDSVRFKEYAK